MTSPKGATHLHATTCSLTERHSPWKVKDSKSSSLVDEKKKQMLPKPLLWKSKRGWSNTTCTRTSLEQQKGMGGGARPMADIQKAIFPLGNSALQNGGHPHVGGHPETGKPG